MVMTGGRPEGSGEDFGGRSLCDCQRVRVALAVLWETAAQRQRIHRARWDVVRSCDARVVIAGVSLVEGGRLRQPVATGRPLDGCRSCHSAEAEPGWMRPGLPRFFIGGDCPCQPMLLETFMIAHAYLVKAGTRLNHPEGAARQHLRSRQHDYTRLRRAEVGAQVRTDRLVTSARAQLLATDEQRLLLADIADEAGSEAPLDRDEQLELRLALRRARRQGISPEDALPSIRRDLAVVRAIFTSGRQVNLGTASRPEYVSWWEAYIELPLGRRRRTSDVPAITAPHCPDAEAEGGLDLPCARAELAYQQVLDRMTEQTKGSHPVIRALYLAMPTESTVDRDHQLEIALRKLASQGRLVPTTVDGLLADPRRRAEAVDAWWELATAP